MKKTLIILVVLCLCCTLGACSANKESVPPATPAPTQAPTALPEFVPSAPEEATGERQEFALYREFLGVNYVPLTQSCTFISGVGLCDLDLDGVAELILFDAGASSAMGVQFFDIADGEVVCVSASCVEVGSRYKGAGFDKRHYVNTADFSAFRLVENGVGEVFFTVTSMNGDDTLRFIERFRFGCNDGLLTLSALCCANEGYDGETGEKKYTVYTRDDETLSEQEYNAINQMLDTANDLGYTLSGFFHWQGEDFSTEYGGVMAMFDMAVQGYVPAV